MSHRFWSVIGLITIFSFGMLAPVVDANDELDAQVVSFSQQDQSDLLLGKIRILSVLKLHSLKFNGQDMVELSGLAWSQDEEMLYAISDHGSVFHFKLSFSGQQLSDIEVVHAYPLKGADGHAQAWPKNDSEGLHVFNSLNGVSGDDELLVSYERLPRIQRHSASGEFRGLMSLPQSLADIEDYSSKNKALEAVTVHPRFGVITAPEQSMESGSDDRITLYALNGKQWTLPIDRDDYSVVAMEVMPDGRLLLLQRQHQFFGAHWIIALDRLQLHDDGHVDQERLGTLESGGDIVPVDNFEGLTHHRDNRYFMISDNNEHALQSTLLVYFEVQN